MEQMQIINDYIRFQGMQVHFRITPPKGDIQRRVLLLNAPLSTMFNWRLLIPELTSLNCLVAQVDLPGSGQSDCGDDIPQDAATRAQMIWGILDEIDAATSDSSQYWHLISHGSSCLTTLTMAQQVPECVASNVFISPLLHAPVKPFYRTCIGRGMLDKAVEKWYYSNILERAGLQAQLQQWFGRSVPDHVFNPMRRSLIRPGMRPQMARLMAEGFVHDPGIFGSFTPMMAIWGQMDPLFTASDAAEFRRLLPAAETHVLHTAAHYPQETHSKAVCDYLRGWLRYIDG